MLENISKALSKCTPAFINHTIKVSTRFSSNYNLIFGRRGTGKTALGLLRWEILNAHNPKRLFGGNVKINHSYFPIETIHSLDGLRLWLKAHKSAKKSVIIDEAGRAIKKRRFMSGVNVEMLEDLQVMRKYNLDLVYIATSEKVVDSGLVDDDLLDGFYDKYSLKHLQYNDVYGNHRLDMYLNDGIPLTSIDFDSYDTATFTHHGTVDDAKIYFKDEQLEALWKWSKGAKAEEVGLNRKTIQEWIRKITRGELEKRLLLPQRSIEDNTEEEGNKQ